MNVVRFALTMTAAQGREVMDTLNHSYVEWAQRQGIEPVLLPNALVDPVRYCRAMGVRGLILTGGNDVTWDEGGVAGPSQAPLRDALEREVLGYAAADELPVFGICRGMQFINVFFGGGVVRGKRDEGMSAPTPGHVARVHEIAVNQEADTRGVLRGRTQVNSFHNDRVTSDVLAPALLAIASAADGTIEAIRHRSKPIVGVQWHPERPGGDVGLDTSLLEAVVTRQLWKDGTA